ncbi:MAG: imidazolonepropionase [Bacteroidetes bacterium]|jgi:imidazolonepropionase|nr:imidazolonepropionase [Bacteroidota bacterium]
MNLLIQNIRQLVTCAAYGRTANVGPAMRNLGVIENATVLVNEGKIRWVGPAAQFNESVADDLEKIDASAFVALPGFVDSHTHCVYAGSRENEFGMRAEGKSYTEIADAGGGILSTVRATRSATRKELKKSGARHLDAMLQHGTTTVEIKSGYGLSEDAEIRMMEAIGDLAQEHLMSVVPTFLPAHAIPPEYRDDPEAYIALIIDRMLPYIAKRKMAEYFDVFCERGYFSVDQTRRLLTAARQHGLKLKLHADELAAIGASHLAAEMRVTSADHLEHIDTNGIRLLKEAGTVGVLLPGVSFFLGHAYAPARTLIDAGVTVAIASDLNPGSCMSFSMPLMMTIACTQMKMTPEEAITASTINAAAAVDRSHVIGSIEVGKDADIILYDVPNYQTIPYFFGTNHVAKVIKRGTLLEF